MAMAGNSGATSILKSLQSRTHCRGRATNWSRYRDRPEEDTMPKWYDGAEEAAFKPVPGGYVAQLPATTLIGRSRRYFVNEAQKDEIAAALRRQRRSLLVMLLFVVPLGMVFGSLMGVLHNQDPGLSPLWLALGCLLLAVVVFLAAVLRSMYVMRSLQPMLGTLPRTQERITLREQVETIAQRVSGKVLVLGIVSGPLMTLSQILPVVDAMQQGRLGFALAWHLIPCLFGALLSAYFAWLLAIRICRNGNPA
jgi:hypothetical protein